MQLQYPLWSLLFMGVPIYHSTYTYNTRDEFIHLPILSPLHIVGVQSILNMKISHYKNDKVGIGIILHCSLCS